MKFEFNVINYNFNKRTTEMFNIFNNINVNEHTEKEIKKYVRSPKKYKSSRNGVELYGFEALCKEIDSIIKWQEWGRCEYEISAGWKFEEDCSNLKAWDCYDQAHANIEIIVRECLYQYKKQKKEIAK